MRTKILLALALVTAGCAGTAPGDGAEATMTIELMEDATRSVTFELAGAWLHSNGTWHRIAPAGTVLGPMASNHTAALAPGSFDALRVVFRNVTVDGSPVIMAENGFELPINVTLPGGTSTRLALAMAWDDALFVAQDGLSFLPALRTIELSRDGEVLLRLTAREIQSATKLPVARMDIFDANAARVFETDFVAESPRLRIIAVGPNLTFQAAGSEAVQQGATLTQYAWDFGDGTTGAGPTVSHLYPLSGGNFTVRLSVTDSNGATDSQTVRMALAPGSLTASQRFSGTATGAYPSGCATSTNGNGMATHALSVDATQTPDGVAADLVRLKLNLYALGNPHAAANIDLRVLDPSGTSIGTGSTSGTSEEVIEDYAAGAAPNGDFTLQVKPCLAYDVDYEIVASMTWLAKEPEPGYLTWLAEYNDGHDHEH